MKIRRLVIGIALAIACAAPASASASGTWTDNELKLTSDATVELVGGWTLVTPLGDFGCEVKVEATLTWSFTGATKTGTGHVNTFDLVTDTCAGTGALEECVLQNDEPTGLPWMLTAKAKDITITGGVTNFYEFGGGECPVEEAESTFAELTLHPDKAKTISKVQITGQWISHIFGLEVEAEAAGELSFTGEAAGTYGVH